MLRSTLCLLTALGLAACATTDSINTPIVDMTGVDRHQYSIDLTECNTYADEVRTAQKAGAGAAGGAVVGAAVGAIFGGSSGAAEGAAAGGVFGAAKGVGQGVQERSVVVKTCLRSRKYIVLN